MWWTDEEWNALIDPARCGMCADAHLPENDHSVLIASTSSTHFRLARNQAHSGYGLVILREHITDLGLLSSELLAAFWSGVQRAGRAVETTFAPRKIDYLVMGHRMPHLHCHLFPQHHDDDPTRNVDISDGPVFLPPNAFDATARRLRAAWEAET